MGEPSQLHPKIRFGIFEVDLSSGEVRRAGIKVKLQDQSFKVLVALLERPGEVVGREQLRQLLWPNATFGDGDHAVNVAVTKLRAALGDSAEVPRVIETLHRRGYRLIVTVPCQEFQTVSVEPGDITARSSAPLHNKAATDLRLNWLNIGVGITVAALCAFAAVVAYLRPRAERTALTPIPFTAYAGLEVCPTFSPDGSQIVFGWNGDPDSESKGFDLYAKVIGSENLLRLTHHPSEFVCPAWSPDGTRIAFHRISGADTGVYIVPALGGPERKLRSTRIVIGKLAHLSWSPDGRTIAFIDLLPPEDSPRLQLLTVETLESKQVPDEAKCPSERLPAFSHSGKLAYSCTPFGVGWDAKTGVYSIETSGGEPRLITALTSGDYTGITPAWTRDDKMLIFVHRDFKLGDKLHEITLSDESLRRVALPEDASEAVISARGDKLAYVTHTAIRTVDVWRKDLQNPQVPAVRLIPSTHDQRNAVYSPDGKHIAFTSTRGGEPEIWMSDADGTHLVRISSQNLTGAPRWSPDSQMVVFEYRPSQDQDTGIYVADITERVPRRILTSIPQPVDPSWSHDGRWIYFTSPSQGGRIYRCPAGGGDAVSVDSSYFSRRDSLIESFDGERLYFAQQGKPAVYFPQQTRPSEVYMVSAAGIDAKSAPIGMPQVAFIDLWTVVAKGIYFVPADAPRSLRYFDFETKQVRHIFESNENFDSGLSVSPDGRWILYSQEDEDNTDIMLVDHFK